MLKSRIRATYTPKCLKYMSHILEFFQGYYEGGGCYLLRPIPLQNCNTLPSGNLRSSSRGT